MKALLIRVGFDGNWGGIRGPIFNDRRFRFIPIPENKGRKGKNHTRYSDFGPSKYMPYLPKDFLISKDLNGNKIRIKIEDCIVHDDPDFDAFTYGDRTKNGRGRAVRKLDPGDYIIFSAGLVPYPKDKYPDRSLNAIYRQQHAIDELKICIVGYFKVDCVKEYPEISSMKEKERKQIENTHLERNPLDKDLIIVKGDEKNKNSGLIKNAFCISKHRKNKVGRRGYVTSPKFNKLTGLEGQISRGWRWIEGDEKVKNLIKKLGPGSRE
jgi:hypothetical protein